MQTEYRLIQLKNHYVIIETDENTWFPKPNEIILVQSIANPLEDYIIEKTHARDYIEVNVEKVVAVKNKNNTTVFDLSLPTFDIPDEIEDVERLAEKEFPIKPYWIGSGENSRLYDDCKTVINSFIQGYNKAKETYKWTDEDISIAISMAYTNGTTGNAMFTDDIFKKISKPKEYIVELKLEGVCLAETIQAECRTDCNCEFSPKITDNKITITKITKV